MGWAGPTPCPHLRLNCFTPCYFGQTVCDQTWMKQIKQTCRKWPRGFRKINVLNNDPCDVFAVSRIYFSKSSHILQYKYRVRLRWNFKWLWFYFLLKLNNCSSVRVCTRHTGILQKTFPKLRWGFDKLCCVCLYPLISSPWSSSEKGPCLSLPAAPYAFLIEKCSNTCWLLPFLIAKTQPWVASFFAQNAEWI